MRSSEDVRWLMAYQLRRAQGERGLRANEVADLLGIGESTVSRNRNPDGAPLSRLTAWRVDQRMPLNAEFRMQDLRDLLVIHEDREPKETDATIAERDVLREYLSAKGTEGLPVVTFARSTLCPVSGAIEMLPGHVEPVDESMRVSYVFLTVSDPLDARVAVLAFFSTVLAETFQLLSVDHLMGRWDMCVKYAIPRSTDPYYVLNALVDSLKEHDTFPHSSQGYQPSAARERTRKLDTEAAEFVKLVVSEHRDMLPFRGDDPSVRKPVHMRVPKGGDYGATRITRVLFYVDFHFVPDDHGSREELLVELSDLTVTTFGPHLTTKVEAIAVGRVSAVLEILIGCGGMPVLSEFNRQFEQFINRRWRVQKYNMFSYDHLNRWLDETG